VDNCENVDKMWVGVTRESAGKALPKAYGALGIELAREGSSPGRSS